ncbi:MAG: amidohydrolase [Anaerolineales bacterium]
MKLLYNANIHTLDSSNSKANAILIARERILAVGEKDKLESIAHGKLEKIDMKGKTILPGLTDAHIHIQHYSLGLSKIDCETKTKADCLQRVAERVKNTKPGEWVLGHGWTQNQWAESSPSPLTPLPKTGEGNSDFPTKEELDVIAPNNPVYLTAKSLHAAWANTAALKLANITNNTPNPKDGAIERDASGNATGILLETAMGLVSSRIPD